MAASKYRRSLKKKLNAECDARMSSLRRENAFLKDSLAELTQQHAQHGKLVERFLSLEILKLESSLPAVDEQLCGNEGTSADGVSMRRERSISCYSREIEELKRRIASISARCQHLENEVAKKQASTTEDVTELQNSLKDALEKNRQWLEYDKLGEDYVRAILDRVFWLEKQLNEANPACSQQHNEEHSDEQVNMSQMQEHYESLLQKTRGEVEVLREQVDVMHKDLTITKNCCEEKQREVEELKQQLDSERNSRSVQDEPDEPDEPDGPEDEGQLSDDSRDLRIRLDKEQRRSVNLELQAALFQKFMLNRHFADQKKIEDLQRQIKITAQDCEDERQNCSYFKKQMVKVLKMLRKNKDHATKQSKGDQWASSSCDAMRSNLTSSPRTDVLNESFLECPKCQAKFPARHYRVLMSHIDVCLV